MFKKLVFLVVIIDLIAGTLLAAKTVKLPEPKFSGKMSVEEAILRRRSERSFYPNELTMEQISQLLWAGQGITERTWGFRTAPSSGSLYPLYMYIVKKDGIFKYVPDMFCYNRSFRFKNSSYVRLRRPNGLALKIASQLNGAGFGLINDNFFFYCFFLEHNF